MLSPYHVPDIVGQPVDDRVAATHKLKVFGLGGFLCYKEDHEAGRDKGHGHDDEDGDDHICTLQARHTEGQSSNQKGVIEMLP